MITESQAQPASIESYLDAQEHKDLLRLLTCGSVDDGKSTLIGRLLYESKLIFEDQLQALRADSRRVGARDGELDLALLLDGLSAEREQGITIDVAYRFFSTERRKFIVADCPGDVRYTRNIVTGASNADAAVILVDAQRGVRTQTRRHSYLVWLLGIRTVVVAVNKLDLVGYSREVFEAVEREYRELASRIGFEQVSCIPLCALRGDNVLTASANTPWYQGPSLVEHLESLEVEPPLQDAPFRMPVQLVHRDGQGFRGYAGLIVAGSIRPGAPVRILPCGQESTVERILTRRGDLHEALAGQSITLTLEDQLDVSRGDVIAAADSPAGVADQFEANIVWMGDEPLHPGRRYLVKLATSTVGATLSKPKHRLDVDTLERLAAKTLALDEIGPCTVTLDHAVAFDPYAENREMGAFIVIDRHSNDTVAAGMLRFALRRSQNVHWQALAVSKAARTRMSGHRPAVVWFTGLSGAGKSSIANALERRLHEMGVRTYLLDGDNVRHGLNKDLGFTEADRIENIRRVGEVARLMVDAGLVVLVSLISPFADERALVRAMVAPGEFYEVFIDTPLEVAERRDVKGLYAKARRGELRNFTGIDSPYEPPASPELRIDTTTVAIEEAAEAVLARLRADGLLDGL